MSGDTQGFVKKLAIEHRGRLVASLMDVVEKDMLPSVPTAVRGELKDRARTRVMQAVGSYHDFVLDCLKASVGQDSVVNEEYLRVLEAIHTDVKRLVP